MLPKNKTQLNRTGHWLKEKEKNWPTKFLSDKDHNRLQQAEKRDITGSTSTTDFNNRLQHNYIKKKQ